MPKCKVCHSNYVGFEGEVCVDCEERHHNTLATERMADRMEEYFEHLDEEKEKQREKKNKQAFLNKLNEYTEYANKRGLKPLYLFGDSVFEYEVNKAHYISLNKGFEKQEKIIYMDTYGLSFNFKFTILELKLALSKHNNGDFVVVESKENKYIYMTKTIEKAIMLSDYDGKIVEVDNGIVIILFLTEKDTETYLQILKDLFIKDNIMQAIESSFNQKIEDEKDKYLKRNKELRQTLSIIYFIIAVLIIVLNRTSIPVAIGVDVLFIIPFIIIYYIGKAFSKITFNVKIDSMKTAKENELLKTGKEIEIDEGRVI